MYILVKTEAKWWRLSLHLCFYTTNYNYLFNTKFRVELHFVSFYSLILLTTTIIISTHFIFISNKNCKYAEMSQTNTCLWHPRWLYGWPTIGKKGWLTCGTGEGNKRECEYIPLTRELYIIETKVKSFPPTYRKNNKYSPNFTCCTGVIKGLG